MKLSSARIKMHPGAGGTVTVPLKITHARSKEAAVVNPPAWTVVLIDLPRGGQATSKELEQASLDAAKFFNSARKEAPAQIVIQADVKASAQTAQVAKTSRGEETIWVSQSKPEGKTISLGDGRVLELCGMP